MRLFYISFGNIPSRWAHTFQMMKMTEAFSRQVESVTLVTGKSIFPLRKKNIDLNEWYGISSSFRIKYIPFLWHMDKEFFEGTNYPRFERMAVVYAKLNSPDLVYTRSIHTAYLCVKLKLPVIIETHAPAENPSFKHLESICRSPYIRGIVTITDVLKIAYKNAGIPENKILVWPDAVDVSLFKNSPDKLILRQKLNLPHNKFIATYCGNLYPGRGIEEIFKCARKLPDVYFMIAGGWDKHIQDRKKEAKDLPNVHFVGFIPNKQVPEFLGASDVLLMPYSSHCKTSGWMSPMKMFEYMAACRPIIATEFPVLRKYLKHEQNAILIPPDNSNELKKAIQRLKLDSALGPRLADAAYQSVLLYSWENRAKDILKRFCNT